MELPQRIKDAIKANNLIIFAGAGLSEKFNLPNWSKLVEDVITAIGREDYKLFIPLLRNKLMSASDVLDKLRAEHHEINKYVSSNFNIQEGDLALHKKLLLLSGQIITTNFDNAFEKASDNSIIPSIYTSTYNISEINKSNKPYIFKLHGSFSEPDNCILFKEQYEKLYSVVTAAKEKLKSIFAEKTILFIGFSFNDPDINLIFDTLDRVFVNNNKHFILSTEPLKFQKYAFLETITLNNYDEVDFFLDTCITYKNLLISSPKAPQIEVKPNARHKFAILSPDPLDLDFKDDISKVLNSLDALDANLYLGTLNLKTLSTIEDYDLLIIVTKVFKSKLYVEDDNLKSDLLSPFEILSSIPNDKISIILITNEKVELVPEFNLVNISSFKTAVLNKFIYKAIKNGDLDIIDNDINIGLTKLLDSNVDKGSAIISSIYGNLKDLSIGKKCLSNIIGRVEEQSAIALKLISIGKSNKFLNVKASGGTGKTTLIKKVAYELYNRGYYHEGVTFKSCENVKSYADFEEILISGFNLTNILNFREYLVENYSFSKIDLLIILDNFETVVNSINEDDYQKVIDLLKFATDYANIVITSREKLSPSEDFEDVYSLTPLITDDALSLFIKYYGVVTSEQEIRILRTEILEDLLNNNPLAIKLVTKSRTSFKKISLRSN
ncbi:SIR2 family protein [Paradesertivirga mongoliensis]|uniref:SIR2 family protein n=1 Tax=Paradesertivirga mongoliensis TaxID=2100740 RepID=A0ABW4ZHR0_9SPHI|nr:SIR2 family protein [Pedobacter mongoliensis]